MVVRIPVRFEMWRGARIEATDRFWRLADVLSIVIDVCYWGGQT
jgi:hypothetical protein